MLYLTNKSFTKRENWYGGKAIDQHCDNISVNNVYLVKNSLRQAKKWQETSK